jgi:hypothetical protein
VRAQLPGALRGDRARNRDVGRIAVPLGQAISIELVEGC